MPRELIETGKTVEAAIESACLKLGCSRLECEFEIVDLPKKGFLGLRNTPAKVRVWVIEPEPAKKPEPRQPAPAPQKKAEPPRERQPQKQQAPKPQPPRQPKPAPEAREEAPARQPEAPKPQPRRQDRPRRESTSVLNPKKTELATAYLESVLKALGLEAELAVREEDGGICVDINGKGLGAIIGRRGETLDAIQYLTSLVANRIDNDYMRITVDCGDYRTKRKETLEALAKKLSAQVLKTNVSKTLEPMNPFERRIIHATVSEIEGVSSTSTGEEPNRRVIITSPTARPARSGGRSDGRERDGRRDGGRPPRSGGPDRGRSGGGRDRDRDRRPPRNPDERPRPNPAAAGAPTKREAPKKTIEAEASGELYGKIDLD